MKQRHLVRPRHPSRTGKRRKSYHRPTEKRLLLRILKEEDDSSFPACNGGIMRIKLKEYYDRMDQAVSAGRRCAADCDAAAGIGQAAA